MGAQLDANLLVGFDATCYNPKQLWKQVGIDLFDQRLKGDQRSLYSAMDHSRQADIKLNDAGKRLHSSITQKLMLHATEQQH